MKRLIWILCVLCCSTQLLSQTGNLVLHDGFSDGYSGYTCSVLAFSTPKETADASTLRSLYTATNGVLLLSSMTKYMTTAEKRFDPITSSDFHIKIKLANVKLQEKVKFAEDWFSDAGFVTTIKTTL